MKSMAEPLTRKFTFFDLRQAREAGRKLAMLTCYDFTNARHMAAAGVPLLLAGDSAGNVVLGYETTLPVSLEFMIEITAAVRRGAPNALVIGDMPFGSYQASAAQGAKNAFAMVQRSGCDGIKVEVAAGHAGLVQKLADAGVAVMAHLGLRPQAVGLMGGYKFQGRTAEAARQIVHLAIQMEAAGAASILLEAVPPEVSAEVVNQTRIPVIGCGAGPACHGHVVVTPDALGLTPHVPRFVPRIGDFSKPLVAALENYVDQIGRGEYPAAEHLYEMPEEEKAIFIRDAAS
jgi:3-methyl-2-oxobutanoate hydroxymethyltransferase